MAQLVAITDRFFLPADGIIALFALACGFHERHAASTHLTCFVLQLSCMSWSPCPTCSLGPGPHLQPQSMAAVVWLVGAFFAKMTGRCLDVHCICV